MENTKENLIDVITKLQSGFFNKADKMRYDPEIFAGVSVMKLSEFFDDPIQCSRNAQELVHEGKLIAIDDPFGFLTFSLPIIKSDSSL